jgi:hypothetical protein
MIKRLLAAAATVALLSAGGAWAQTGGNAGVGTSGGASVGTGGTSLGTNDKARGNAAVKKDRDGTRTRSSGSAGVGAGSSSGIGAGTGSSGSVGVNPGGLSGDANTSTRVPSR